MSEEKPVEVEEKTEVQEEAKTENVVPEVKAEETATESSEDAKPKEDDVVFSQEELENFTAKKEAKAERRARRKLEVEYEKKLKEQKEIQAQQVTPQPATYATPVSTLPPGYVNDPILGPIPEDTTDAQKLAMIETALTQASGQPPYQQPAQPQQQVPAPAPVNEVQKPAASERLIDQLEDFVEEHPDLEKVLETVNIKLDMLENAALYKNGLKNLYEEAKANPSKIFKISSLTDERERNLKMFELNDSNKDTSKKLTKVPAQPEPITGGSSIGAKSPSQMSEAELREKYIRDLK